MIRIEKVRRFALKGIVGFFVLFLLVDSARKNAASGRWIAFSISLILATALSVDVLWFALFLAYVGVGAATWDTPKRRRMFRTKAGY
ncbi:MAG: hypothetical protein ABEI52_10870 [Halobacteriaceae archaeon]